VLRFVLRLLRLPVLRLLRLLPLRPLLVVFLRRRFGTFAPERRASERPMAIACLRLVTFLPERPLRSVPRLRSRMTFSTFFDAFLLYFLAMGAPSDNRVVPGAQHEPCQMRALLSARRAQRRRGTQTGHPSSTELSVSTRRSEPSMRMTAISPYG